MFSPKAIFAASLGLVLTLSAARAKPIQIRNQQTQVPSLRNLSLCIQVAPKT